MTDKKQNSDEKPTNEVANSFRKQAKLNDAFDHQHEQKDSDHEKESDAMLEHYADDDNQ
ncbi:hypothetical protein MUO14_14200 [Halobacillus shinanisalinarum]|uniref:DUF4025 domain-containing protein n=1 Tax=Halobacillus shinanisalinarum TaxID=2932258 RepID=A0ABY4GWD5_9BACI|nr:hypothetical protein [Halobacillus shinanisalinarum]UOQ91697.1 hypothetical protein MUO14_14200 [Halobacillus shinanisalinarum]